MATTFQQFVQPAQGLFNSQKQPYSHTQYEMISSVQSSPYVSYSNAVLSPSFAEETKSSPISHKARQRFKRIQRIIEIMFGIADVCSCLLTLFIQAVMIVILIKFYQTRNIPAPNRTGPWAKQTKLWPTYMLAGAALATFLLAVIGLILSVLKKGKHKTRAKLTIKVVRFVIVIGCWIAVAAFYRIAKTGKDLWGWSCSQQADAIQQYYKSDLNFDRLCNIQTSSWIASVAEVGTKILFAAVGFYYQFQLDGIKRSILKDLGEAGWETFQGLS